MTYVSQITLGIRFRYRPTFMISISDCAHCILLNRHIRTWTDPSTEVRFRRLTSPTGPAPPRPRARSCRSDLYTPRSRRSASRARRYQARSTAPVTRVLVPPRMRSGVHTPRGQRKRLASAVAPRKPDSEFPNNRSRVGALSYKNVNEK